MIFVVWYFDAPSIKCRTIICHDSGWYDSCNPLQLYGRVRVHDMGLPVLRGMFLRIEHKVGIPVSLLLLIHSGALAYLTMWTSKRLGGWPKFRCTRCNRHSVVLSAPPSSSSGNSRRSSWTAGIASSGSQFGHVGIKFVVWHVWHMKCVSSCYLDSSNFFNIMFGVVSSSFPKCVQHVWQNVFG